MIQVGKKAPDFAAPAYQQGKFISIKLSDYLGKWVLLCFYPGDFTFVWATEISAVAEKYSEFQKLGVEILSMSIDSMFVHKMWDDKELWTRIFNQYKVWDELIMEFNEMSGLLKNL